MKSTTYNIQSEIKFVKFMEESMEELDEVVKKLSFRERVIFKIFRKIFTKFYNIVRINIVNNFLFGK